MVWSCAALKQVRPRSARLERVASWRNYIGSCCWVMALVLGGGGLWPSGVMAWAGVGNGLRRDTMAWPGKGGGNILRGDPQRGLVWWLRGGRGRKSGQTHTRMLLFSSRLFRLVDARYAIVNQPRNLELELPTLYFKNSNKLSSVPTWIVKCDISHEKATEFATTCITWQQSVRPSRKPAM